MSKLMKAPISRARRRMGRRRSFRATIERPGSAGCTSGVSADTLTERLRRGRGPLGPDVAEAGLRRPGRSPSRPCPGRPGCAAGRRPPRTALTTVSPRRSIVVAIPAAALARNRFTRSSGVAPGDELPGHRGHVRLHGPRDEGRREGRGGEARLHRRAQLHGLVAEVFLQVADDLRRRSRARAARRRTGRAAP